MTSRFFADFFTPLVTRHKRSDPPQIWHHKSSYTPQKNKQISSFKRNMFQINSIVVCVEKENNYMSKNFQDISFVFS